MGDPRGDLLSPLVSDEALNQIMVGKDSHGDVLDASYKG